MRTFDTLMELECEELKRVFMKSVEDNRIGHDVAVMMGSLGVSPKHMEMYNESIRLIKEHEDRMRGVEWGGE